MSLNKPHINKPGFSEKPGLLLSAILHWAVETARCYKTIDLKVRPIYHRASSSGEGTCIFMSFGL